MAKKLEIRVYGSGASCSSCERGPTVQDTVEWLQAALDRVYGDQVIVVWCEEVWEEDPEGDLWYPLFVLAGEVIAEGTPRLRQLMQKLDERMR